MWYSLHWASPTWLLSLDVVSTLQVGCRATELHNLGDQGRGRPLRLHVIVSPMELTDSKQFPLSSYQRSMLNTLNWLQMNTFFSQKFKYVYFKDRKWTYLVTLLFTFTYKNVNSPLACSFLLDIDRCHNQLMKLSAGPWRPLYDVKVKAK